MNRRKFIGCATLGLAQNALVRGAARPALVLDADSFRHHVDFFNGMVPEEVVNYIPNSGAWKWMAENIPRFTCPDSDVEQIYYYRWWVFRKHIKKTPVGFIVTEFLKPVKHAGEYNSLSCAFGHHLGEGQWLHDGQYMREYASFWLRTGPNGGLRTNFHQFSGWASAALYSKNAVDGDREFLVSCLDPLIADYRAWETERLTPDGLFWQRDVSDGMEESISGGRRVKNRRPSINSYMYGNAQALASIARLAGREPVAAEYREKAAKLKQLVEDRLWNADARFFETRLESGPLADVREEIGFTPWYFDLPGEGKGYEAAWKQLMDPKGFYAPYGPTTAEQRSPGFKIATAGDDCQWNGPSWPFSTTITLKALANVLHGGSQKATNKEDYWKTFLIYTKSQHRKLDNGQVIPWIDENLNPFTGEWWARALKIKKGTFYGRGNHYNHSGYCDLVISGVVGLRPRADNVVEVEPLLPAGTWDWLCLDNVLYHGRILTILWDKTGKKFNRGQGLILFADGKQLARSSSFSRLSARL
ncbi:MAG TPA: glycosyl hydrolase family 65 protein [Bryobacteraceae bacterium]|nr:glycosyl hydrolase family 65 protein [Bryobacteraceae bacterium]